MKLSELTEEEMQKSILTMHDKLKAVEIEIEKLALIREQLIEDIELAELITMHQLNKRERRNEL